ncbi:MAG: manganese efflux pump MntP family protein [Candidatus Micrarchaeia archaeon]|jgi:putative Mn2+ efflux pump MntP
MLVPLLIAIGLSMDSFAVSLACGVAGRAKRLWHSAKIALSFAAFQSGMALIGYLLGESFLPLISSLDHWLAFFLLLYIGARMVIDSGKPKKCPAEKKLTLRKLLLLSLATSIDALAVGISFAFLKIDPAATLALIAVVTFALSFSGAYLSGRLREAIGRKAELAGGLVLVAIGVKILLEHTGWLVL